MATPKIDKPLPPNLAAVAATVEEPAVTPMEKPADPVVDPATLQQILEHMAAQDKEIEVLRATVDRNALLAVEKAKKPQGLPTAYLKILNGKPVVGWKSEKSQYLYNPSNPEAPIGEILKATYFFMDGTDSGVIDQVEFTRCIEKLEGEVVEGLKAIQDFTVKEITLHFTRLVSTDEDLQAAFVMPADYKINKNFINP